MTENYTTDDLQFSAVLHCVYGPESLLKMEQTDAYHVRLTFDVPAEEGQSLFADWRAHRLGTTDVKAVFASYNEVQKRLREMRRNNEDVWESVLAIGRG
jgi:hypothetical protein